MVRNLLACLAIVCLFVSCDPLYAQDPNDVPGLTAWALAGGGVQEVRIGYQGLLPETELAIGAQHIDAPDGMIEEWPIRGYAIAHAISAEMLAQAFGQSAQLPQGNIYGGVFGEWTYDREDEWSGGYIVGGLVDWPRKWQTVVEYQSTVWNASDNGYEVLFGLRRRF